LFFNANSTILQLYHGENKLIFIEMMMRSALHKTNTLCWIFLVLAHWNNSPRIHISPHSETLHITNLYSFSLMLCDLWRSNKYQF